MKDKSNDNSGREQEQRREKLYTIPDEGSCSPEFSRGCIIGE